MTSDSRQPWQGSSLRDIFNSCDVWTDKNVPTMSPNRNHAILFHLPLPENNEIPKPQRGPILWDQDHVRLPCSSENRFKEISDSGKEITKPRWQLIEESLLQPIHTSRDLEIAIKSYNTRYESEWNFGSLHELFEVHTSPGDSSVFFNSILPKIINLALQLPHIIQCPIPLLKQGMNRSISMSQQQAACLLANAFLCTFPRRNTNKKNSEYSQYPSINFNRLYSCSGQNVIEKLRCICNYFQRVLCMKMPTNIITFQRQSLNSSFKWESCNVKLSRLKFHISSEGKIEEGHGMLQVDFANKFVGGGVLGHGCVQEEIRFVINPEMIIARLFTEALGDEEALTMIGCEQFSSYSGYASTFKWADNFQDKTPLDIYRRKKSRVVAIDALFYNNSYEQFKEPEIRRELNKAYVGFLNDSGRDEAPVASGLWGCGAFNGYSIRSALIQLMACAVNDRNLVFYTFDDASTQKEVAEIFQFVTTSDISVSSLYRLLKRYRFDGSPNDPTQLATFIRKEYRPIDTASKPTLVTNESGAQPQGLFKFRVPPKSKLFGNNDDAEKTWNWNRASTSSNSTDSSSSSSRHMPSGSRDKQKFDNIEKTFAVFKNNPDPVKSKPETEKPKDLKKSSFFDANSSFIDNMFEK